MRLHTLILALVAAGALLDAGVTCTASNASIDSAFSTPPYLALSGYRSKAAAATAARQIRATSAYGKRRLYENWCRRYRKKLDDRRYRAWLSNLDGMVNWNLRPNPPFLKGMIGLSDYTPAELARMVMRRSDPSRARTRGGGVSVGAAVAAAAAIRGSKADLPNEWNWDKQGAVSEVRDQTLAGVSRCGGACWAFAALAALESRARIDGTDRGPDYSEQQVIDCAIEAAGYSSYGCDGGTAEDVFNFASASFVAQETGYAPYTARNGNRCRAASTLGAVTVKPSPGFDVVAGNPEAIMRALVDAGPLVAYMFVLPPTNPASFLYYDSVIVGYNRAEKYWIVRNSWGIGWGIGGYARLEMTDGGSGPCNMKKG
ncbi:hypothetical protein ABPG75_012247 [Micractinium tetrahymenae]